MAVNKQLIKMMLSKNQWTLLGAISGITINEPTLQITKSTNLAQIFASLHQKRKRTNPLRNLCRKSIGNGYCGQRHVSMATDDSSDGMTHA